MSISEFHPCDYFDISLDLVVLAPMFYDMLRNCDVVMKRRNHLPIKGIVDFVSLRALPVQVVDQLDIILDESVSPSRPCWPVSQFGAHRFEQHLDHRSPKCIVRDTFWGNRTEETNAFTTW